MASWMLDTLPPISDDRLVELKALAVHHDSEIDLSDIPELNDEQWATAVRGSMYRPVKTPVTLRLDADVVAWFKPRAAGRGYQTEINRVLCQRVADAAA